MNRAKALQELRSLLEGELRWGRTTSNRATRQAYTQAISDMETLGLLAKTLKALEKEHKPTCEELSGELDFYHEGCADGYDMAHLLVTDSAALRAEAKRLGVKGDNIETD